MAERRVSLDTKTPEFPFDMKLKQSGALSTYLSTDQNVANPIYFENVIPVSNGYASAGFYENNNVLPIDAVEDYSEADVYPIYAPSGETGYLIVDYAGLSVKTYGPQIGIAEEISYSASEKPVSVFFLRDRSYFFHPDFGLRYVNSQFISVSETLKGLIPANLIGMTSCLSYLIAWDDERIYWSDPTDYLEFDPTGVTSNAGSSGVLGVRGKITMVLTAPKGFIIYTAGNITRARFTQNVRNPWSFAELRNSSGVAKSNQVTDYENLGTHFIWSSAGFGIVGDDNVEYPFSQLTEFLDSDILSTVDFVDSAMSTTINEIVETQEKFKVKMSFLANRYIGISYGQYDGMFTDLFLFDLHLNRWGKIKKDHLCAFNFIPPKKETESPASDFYDETTPGVTPAEDYLSAAASEFLPRDYDYNYWGKDFALLQPDGFVLKVTVNDKDDASHFNEGVMIYGDVALTLRTHSTISEVNLSGVLDTYADLEVKVRNPEITGDTFYNYTKHPNKQTYYGGVSGLHNQIMIRGKFNLSSIQALLVDDGVA